MPQYRLSYVVRYAVVNYHSVLASGKGMGNASTGRGVIGGGVGE
jgi:hypothetical protein